MLKSERSYSEVYNKTREYISSYDESLVKSLPESFGSSIGLESKNDSLSITGSNHALIQKSMMFYIKLSFSNLKNEKLKTYSLEISDIVLLKANNTAEVLTNEISKDLTDISYNMEGDEESNSNQPKPNAKQSQKANLDVHANRVTRSNRNKSGGGAQKSTENNWNRKEHQLDLLKQKNLEFNERYKGNKNGDEEQLVTRKHIKDIECYKNKNQLPTDLKPGKIYVDMKYDCILLPIFKNMVPFHGSLIKSVTKTKEGIFVYLRLNFITPITGLSSAAINV